jgi:hypothetical protein
MFTWKSWLLFVALLLAGLWAASSLDAIWDRLERSPATNEYIIRETISAFVPLIAVIFAWAAVFGLRKVRGGLRGPS